MKATLLIALFITLIGVLLFPQLLWAQSSFDNPKPGSFQSGKGVIDGWVCDAERIDIVFNPDTTQEQTFQAAYGTERGDTQSVCNDSNNGFGLLFNWNLLGDGQHTVSARADGVEFDSATFTVTTLGEEYKTGLSGGAVVADFPAVGTDTTLVWQESLQNFVIQGDVKSRGGTSGAPPRVLDNPKPGSFQSGKGVIDGWVCDAERIDVVFNPGTKSETTFQAAYGTDRGDTQGHCNDIDNGFGLLFNWNLLGDGQHTVGYSSTGIS
ncbi:MAG: hypothetical protein OXC18_14635 [Desulfurellaceae bacterium]|nr:hypothetical protein [Desulfurellaceae bacterium]